MSKLKTALAFSKNLLTTGALFQTSRKVELAITSKITSGSDQVIVEFGMGHGNITEEILKKLGPKGKLYSFEINSEFCDLVREKIKDERLVIVNKGAEDLKSVVDEQLDGIVSSIPFSIMPKETVNQIVQISLDKLKSGAFFSQIQYSRVMKKRFKSFFPSFEIDQVSMVPPELIYHCAKD